MNEQKIANFLGVEQVHITDKTIISTISSPFNGEGFYFEKYNLSKNSIEVFIQNKNKQIPVRRDYKNKNWRRTPFYGVDSLMIETQVLSYTYNEELSNELNSLRDILFDNQAYYAYYFKENGMYELYLFILDIKNKTFIYVETFD